MTRLSRCLALLAISAVAVGQNWSGHHGPGRGFHVGASAAPGGGVVQFGGMTNSWISPPGTFYLDEALRWTWRYDVSGWHHMQVGGGPSPLHEPMMCFDSARGRSVLYGGSQVGLPNTAPQTWEWDGSAWHQVVTSQTPPVLTAAALAFDPGRGVVVLHGGLSYQGQVSDETWEYDGLQWQQVPTNNSPTQVGWGPQAMAYSPTLGVCVRLVSGSQGWEVWHFDGVDWTQNTAVVGAPQSWSRLVTGPNGGVVAVGRSFVGGAGHETWRYDGASWQQVMTANAPPAWRDTWAVYDASRNVVLHASLDEVWCFDGADWSLESATRLQRTHGAAIAFDARRERLVMFGGWKDAANGAIVEVNEHWEWDGAQWQQRTFSVTPSPRANLVGCYDRARGRMVFAESEGANGPSLHNEVWEFDGQSWAAVGTTPAAIRDITAMVYDAGRRACVVLTRGNPSSLNNHQLWTYDGVHWTELPTATRPPHRKLPVLAYDAARDRIVLHGGHSGATIRSDTWEYVGGDWLQRFPQVRPTTGYVAGVYDPVRGRVVVRSHADGGMWEWDGSIWLPLPSSVPPPRTHSQSLFFDTFHEQLLGLGGWAEVSVWRPDPVPHWAATGFACLQPGSTAASPPILAPAASSSPTLGTTLTLEVQGLTDPNAPVMLLLGQRSDVLAGQSLPLDLTGVGLPGCQLWLAPKWTEASFAVAGVASFALPLPANAALAGSHLWVQAVEVDVGGPLAVGGLSNAGVATLH